MSSEALNFIRMTKFPDLMRFCKCVLHVIFVQPSIQTPNLFCGMSQHSGASSSRSPSPVSFSIVDLTSYWPIHRLSKKIPPRELFSTEISPQSDGNGGFSVAERGKNSKTSQLSIPSHYRNALCLLAAKIAWLQVNTGLLTRHLAKHKQLKVVLANSLDGLRRSLTFSIAVRDLFYDDVKEASPIMQLSPDFRSRHLDSWLYVEFHSSVHHPPAYQELAHLEKAEREPLKISVQGRVIFTR
jgi:hypothetical protein